MASKFDLASSGKIILSLRDFSGRVRKCAEGFKCVYWGNRTGKRNLEGRLLEFLDE